jgi:hypothetical protein
MRSAKRRALRTVHYLCLSSSQLSGHGLYGYRYRWMMSTAAATMNCSYPSPSSPPLSLSHVMSTSLNTFKLNSYVTNPAALAGNALARHGPNPLHNAFQPNSLTVTRQQSTNPPSINSRLFFHGLA